MFCHICFNFCRPLWTYSTTLLNELCSVMGPFSWSSAMKKSVMWCKDNQISYVTTIISPWFYIIYLYDFLWSPIYQPSPINRGTSSDNWKRYFGAETHYALESELASTAAYSIQSPANAKIYILDSVVYSKESGAATVTYLRSNWVRWWQWRWCIAIWHFRKSTFR